jgi:hypothetical protein
MPEKKTLYDELTKGLADAIVDIREKVVEEPWFGRVVTERETADINIGWPEPREVQPEQGEHERDVADDGIDR